MQKPCTNQNNMAAESFHGQADLSDISWFYLLSKVIGSDDIAISLNNVTKIINMLF